MPPYYAPFNLDEYHAWFSLYWLCQAARNRMKAKNSKRKYLYPSGIEPATYRFQNWRLRQFGQADSWRAVVLTIIRSWHKINTCYNKCIKCIVLYTVKIDSIYTGRKKCRFCLPVSSYTHLTVINLIHYCHVCWFYSYAKIVKAINFSFFVKYWNCIGLAQIKVSLVQLVLML